MRVERDLTKIKSSSERVNNIFEPTSQFGICLSKICGIPNKNGFFVKKNENKKICRCEMGEYRIK
jgi:hypothetical protein